MTGSIAVAGAPAAAQPGTAQAATAASTPTANPNAPAYVLRDATAPPVLSGTVHDVDFPIIEKDMTVAAGYVVHVWTFGGTVPGPIIRVHLGDTVRVHLTNHGTMSHSIDFHASQTAMERPDGRDPARRNLHLYVHRRVRRRLDVPLRHGADARAHRERHVRHGHRRAEGRVPEGRSGARASSRASGTWAHRASRPTTRRRTRRPPRRTSSSSTAWPTSTRTTRSRSRPGVASGSSSSTWGRTWTARSTSSGRSSTRSKRRGSS